jgi:Flp pilus assembly protein CpaB
VAVSAGDLRTTEMPAVFAPPGSLGSMDDAEGLVTVGPIAAGEVLVRSRLAASAFATSIAPGNVAVTVGVVSAPTQFSVADRVDAYATYAGARPYTALVGEDLHVLAIGESSTSVSGPATLDVTLDVDPETARQLFQAAVGGALGLAIHPPVVTATPSPSPGQSAGWSPPPA